MYFFVVVQYGMDGIVMLNFVSRKMFVMRVICVMCDWWIVADFGPNIL